LAEQAGAGRAAARALLDLTEGAPLAGDVDEAVTIGRTAVQVFRASDQPANVAVALIQVCNALLYER